MTTVDTPAAGGVPPQYTFGAQVGNHAHEQRLVLTRILDEHSIGVLSGVGVAAGWRCLDVGAGAGSITAWLAATVGPSGHVTSIDLDPSQIAPGDNITVVSGDVHAADLPDNHFDLVHTRTVMVFLPDREQLLRRFVAALKPGGVLVISDFTEPATPLLLHAPSQLAAEAYVQFQQAIPAIMRSNGADTSWSWRVPLVMRDAGLTDIQAVVHSRLWHGGQPGNLLHLHNSYLLEGALRAHGMSTEHLDALRSAMADPQTMAYLFPIQSTTGRKPI